MITNRLDTAVYKYGKQGVSDHEKTQDYGPGRAQNEDAPALDPALSTRHRKCVPNVPVFRSLQEPVLLLGEALPGIGQEGLYSRPPGPRHIIHRTPPAVVLVPQKHDQIYVSSVT